jgi:hypothetical protein
VDHFLIFRWECVSFFVLIAFMIYSSNFLDSFISNLRSSLSLIVRSTKLLTANERKRNMEEVWCCSRRLVSMKRSFSYWISTRCIRPSFRNTIFASQRFLVTVTTKVYASVLFSFRLISRRVEGSGASVRFCAEGNSACSYQLAGFQA